jgi:hypothetical protein
MLTVVVIGLVIGLATVAPILIAFEVIVRRGGKPTSGRLDH